MVTHSCRQESSCRYRSSHRTIPASAVRHILLPKTPETGFSLAFARSCGGSPRSLGLALLLCLALLVSTDLSAAPFAYVANFGSANISVIDTATNTVTATIPMGTNPYGVSVNPAGTRAYVTNYDSNSVSVIDAGTNTVVATIPVGTHPLGIAVNPAGTKAYVANSGSNNVSVIDTSTNTVAATVPVEAYPHGIAVNSAGTKVYVANYNSNSVSVIDTSTNTVGASVTVSAYPVGIAVNPAGSKVYVVGYGNLIDVVDAGANTLITSISACCGLHGVAVSSDGTKVYATGWATDSAFVIDAATNTVTATVAVGDQPRGVEINPVGTRLYVANYGSNSVSVIDTSTNTVIATVPVGTSPYSLGQFIAPNTGCVTLPSGMVSWWGGDNNALDMVGTNNGTLQGSTTYAPGKVGQAFSFDGSEAAYVEIPNTAAFNPGGAFSIDGWFYIDPAASGNAGEIATLVGKTEGSTGNGWALYFDDRWSTKSLKFVVGTILEFQNAIPAADWYHIAGVFDPSTTPNSRLYINGALAASISSGGPTANIRNVRIGAMNWTDSYHQGNDRLNGKADEVEFFNRALTAEEIAAIYNAGSAGKCRSCTPPPSNMTSWWKGDGNTDDIIGGNNGTLVNGATYASGKVGQAFSFDGVNDYIQVGGGVGDFGSSPFTVDFWMYDATNPAGNAYLIGKSHPDGGLGWDIRFGSNVIYVIGVNGWDVNITSDASVTLSAWHHIAVTSTDSLVTLYIDGVVKGTSPRSSISSTGNPLRLGDTTNFGDAAFNGLIDEVEIFNRALSADEIATIYNAGSAGKCAPDSTLEAFAFTAVTGATRSTPYTSTTIEVRGINVPAAITITGGEYSIGCTETFTGNEGTVVEGNTVCVRQTSSASYSTPTIATLTIGGVSADFSVTTMAAPTYDITVSAPGGNGTIVCDTPVTEGNNSVCTITPSPHYHLFGLTDNGTDVLGQVVNNTYTINNVTANHTVGGTFVIDSYLLTVSKTGTGSGIVTSSPGGIVCGSDCTESYYHGTPVTLTAAPAPDSLFAGWSGACTGTGDCTVLMDDAKSVGAAFSRVIAIGNGAATTSIAAVPLVLAHPAAAKMQFLVNNLTWTAWESFAAAKTVTLPAGDGLKSVSVRFMDGAGNTSSVYSDTIVLDTRAPVGSVTINSGAAVTASPDVTLTLAVVDVTAVADMQVSESSTFTGASWETFAPTKTFHLNGSYGTRTVYARFRDSGGKVSATVSDAILYQQDAPPAGDAGGILINGGAPYTTVAGVKLAVTPPAGNTQMSLSNNGSTWGGWIAVPAAEKAYTLPAGDGVKTVYAKFRTAGGVESGIYADSITLDTKPPAGSVVIDSGAYSTNDRHLTLTLAATDLNGVTHMQFSTNGTTWPPAWQTFATSSAIDLPPGDGIRKVYAKFRDAAGKVSAACYDTIVIDTTAPAGKVVINAGAATTTNPLVNLTITASGAPYMQVSVDGGATWDAWEPFAKTKKVTLPGGSGTKTVSVRLRDATGNESAQPFSDTISLI